MRIEAPVSVDEFGFPLEGQRTDLYSEVGSLIYRRLEESKLGTAFLELSGLPKKSAELVRSGVRNYIFKEAGTYLYEIHGKTVTDPNDNSHHILIFSKKPWEEIVWEGIVRQINQTDNLTPTRPTRAF